MIISIQTTKYLYIVHVRISAHIHYGKPAWHTRAGTRSYLSTIATSDIDDKGAIKSCGTCNAKT